MENCATLSSKGNTTSFSFGDSVVRFRTSDALNRYLCVKEWDKGYLVVDALYDGQPEPIEEYIDLIPILENLYQNAETFLAPIKEVCVEY